MNDETTHLIELEFIPVESRTPSRYKSVNEITEKLKLWEYIPSIPCIQQVFNTTWETAKMSQIKTITNKRAWKSFIDTRITKIRQWRANNRARAMFDRHFLPNIGAQRALRDNKRKWNW